MSNWADTIGGGSCFEHPSKIFPHTPTNTNLTNTNTKFSICDTIQIQMGNIATKQSNLTSHLAKIHFMVLTLLKFQNVNWFVRNTDFPVKSFWKISDAFRPKTPPTTPRSLFWHIKCDVPKWKIMNMLLDGYQSHDI